MAEYIELDVALKALCQVSAPTPSESYIVEKCIEKINGLPMIEVVRCKDCKYYELHKCHNNANGWFSHRMSDDFCSYGERREGE